MGIYRTYFDKNNTIIKNSLINTGRNQISELYFGEKNSRFLFYCSFDEIIEKVNNKEIIINDNVKHYLKIKNTSNFDVSSFLSENNNLVFGDKFRSSSFDLELRPINEFWDEGMGYDFELSPLSNPQNRDFNEEPSNWFKGTNFNDFSTPGGSLDNVIAQQHFDKGNEDILMDITDFVNTLIVSGSTSGNTINYNGFCLKYTDDYENINLDDLKTYVVGFFTRHTQTFFEPYIETYYDDLIIDDRVDFYLNKKNRLYLYVNVDGKLTNLDELPEFSINSVELTEQPLVKQQTKGVYYVEFVASDTIFDSYTEYKDIWSNIKINGIERPDIKLKFIPKPDTDYYQMGSDILEPIKYGVSISGIRREEKLTQGEIKKINIHLRKPYTVFEQDVVTNVFYRLYVKQGNTNITVLDWLPVSKIYNTNSFNIDTTWMIPQVYYIDIKVERNGEVNIYNEELKFTILNKK